LAPEIILRLNSPDGLTIQLIRSKTNGLSLRPVGKHKNIIRGRSHGKPAALTRDRKIINNNLRLTRKINIKKRALNLVFRINKFVNNVLLNTLENPEYLKPLR